MILFSVLTNLLHIRWHHHIHFHLLRNQTHTHNSKSPLESWMREVRGKVLWNIRTKQPLKVVRIFKWVVVNFKGTRVATEILKIFSRRSNFLHVLRRHLKIYQKETHLRPLNCVSLRDFHRPLKKLRALTFSLSYIQLESVG